MSFCLISLPRVYFMYVTDTVKVDLNANATKETNSKDDQLSQDVKNLNLMDDGKANASRAQTFTFEELAAATGNFRLDCFLGEGGFGKVYKGHLERINQVILMLCISCSFVRYHVNVAQVWFLLSCGEIKIYNCSCRL